MSHQMVKWSVAAAIALGASGLAVGATTDFNSSTGALGVSVEKAAIDAAANSSAVYTLPTISFGVGNNSYANGHKVVLTVAGATVFSASDIATVVCTPGTTAAGTMSLIFEGVANNEITLTVANRNAVAVHTAGAFAASANCAISGIKVLASSLTSPSQVTLGYRAQTASGTVYDTLEESANAANPVLVAASMRNISLVACSSSVRNPYTNASRSSALVGAPSSGVCSGASTPFDGLIAGSFFSGTGDAAHTDTLNWVVRNEEAAGVVRSPAAPGTLVAPAQDPGLLVSTRAAAPISLASTGKTLVHTITGDFTVVDDDANGCTIPDLTAGAGQLAVTSTRRVDATATSATEANATIASISTDCRTLVLNSSVNTAVHGLDQNFAISVYLNGLAQSGVAVTGAGGSRAGRALAAASFSVRTELKNTAADTAALSTVEPSGGSWSLPLALTGSANIPYVPYGAGISRIVYVTNTSSTVPLTVALSARSEAGTSCASTNFSTVTIPAAAVVNIGGAIDAGVRACFPTIDSVGGKVQVNIASTGTTASAGTFEVTSSYNVSGNRVNVINSTN
jgi:hypothetical protein